MKITNIEKCSSNQNVTVLDTFVTNGYVKSAHGSLPDVDCDFESTKRQLVKEYIERRYNHDGKQRVFSAGTMTTLKLKAVLKDVARVHRVPVYLVNIITSMIVDDKADWTELFKMAYTNRKIHDFIMKYPEVIEDIRTIMGQPRSSSIHASALLVTPDKKDGKDMECFDFTPIKKIDGVLISEFDGYSLDEQGLLKNDCLGIKELSKLHEMINLCNSEYNAGISLESLAKSGLDDKEVYELFKYGYTQNIFQFASKGMTKFVMDLEPTCIGDLIAANALFRPATLDSGSAERYIQCKSGLAAPTYLWGTYEALKDTYAQMIYQEDLSKMSKDVGGFSLGEGVKLVKFISKKKTDKIKAMKDKFMAGAKAKGCPNEDAIKIWDMIESGGSYLFNKCISGNEKIQRCNKGGGKKGWTATIAEMYKVMNDKQWAIKNGHESLYEKYNRCGYGYGWSLCEDGKLRKNKVVDIRYMGTRSIYRITLSNGSTLDVTANHKHPTANGIKRTDELIEGEDQMIVNTGWIKRDTSYLFTDKGKSNDPIYHSNKNVYHYEINSEEGHMGFTKRDTLYTQLKYYQDHLKKGYCEICGKTDCRLEVHHVNGDHSDVGKNYSNLQTLCVSCHKKAHYNMGRTKMGERGLGTEYVTVVSVDYVGEDEVYDVEMDSPNHTFVTGQGIVTCNSHATAYGVTAYIGAWIKVHYPTVFYNVALEWAKDEDIPAITSEMEMCSNAKLVPPDINVSNVGFESDYKDNLIYWSLSRIKMVGKATVDYIVAERKARGEFTSIENFIERIFKYKLKKYQYWDDPDDPNEAERCPVNARHIRNLIMAGCFDNIEHAESVVERYPILVKAADLLGFKIQEKDVPSDLRDKHYFWSQQQVIISGIGSIDYKRIFDNSEIKPKLSKKARYISLQDTLEDKMDGERRSICASIVEIEEKKYTSKKDGSPKLFCKIKLQQNNDLTEMVIWSEEWARFREKFYIDGSIAGSKNKVLIASCSIKFSDFNKCNTLQLDRFSNIQII